MLHAESITLDGGEVAIILLFLFALLAVWVTVVVIGCVAARRAGRGSRTDAVTWAALAVVAVLPGLVGGPNVLLPAGLCAVLLQAGFYLYGRDRK